MLDELLVCLYACIFIKGGPVEWGTCLMEYKCVYMHSVRGACFKEYLCAYLYSFSMGHLFYWVHKCIFTIFFQYGAWVLWNICVYIYIQKEILLDFNLHLQSFWYKNDKMIKGKLVLIYWITLCLLSWKIKKKYILSPFYSKIYIYYAKNNTWRAHNKTMGCVALF